MRLCIGLLAGALLFSTVGLAPAAAAPATAAAPSGVARMASGQPTTVVTTTAATGKSEPQKPETVKKPGKAKKYAPLKYIVTFPKPVAKSRDWWGLPTILRPDNRNRPRTYPAKVFAALETDEHTDTTLAGLHPVGVDVLRGGRPVLGRLKLDTSGRKWKLTVPVRAESALSGRRVAKALEQFAVAVQVNDARGASPARSGKLATLVNWHDLDSTNSTFTLSARVSKALRRMSKEVRAQAISITVVHVIDADGKRYRGRRIADHLKFTTVTLGQGLLLRPVAQPGGVTAQEVIPPAMVGGSELMLVNNDFNTQTQVWNSPTAVAYGNSCMDYIPDSLNITGMTPNETAEVYVSNDIDKHDRPSNTAPDGGVVAGQLAEGSTAAVKEAYKDAAGDLAKEAGKDIGETVGQGTAYVVKAYTGTEEAILAAKVAYDLFADLWAVIQDTDRCSWFPGLFTLHMSDVAGNITSQAYAVAAQFNNGTSWGAGSGIADVNTAYQYYQDWWLAGCGTNAGDKAKACGMSNRDLSAFPEIANWLSGYYSAFGSGLPSIYSGRGNFGGDSGISLQAITNPSTGGIIWPSQNPSGQYEKLLKLSANWNTGTSSTFGGGWGTNPDPAGTPNLSGNNDALSVNWKGGFTINPTSGLTTAAVNRPVDYSPNEAPANLTQPTLSLGYGITGDGDVPAMVLDLGTWDADASTQYSVDWFWCPNYYYAGGTPQDPGCQATTKRPMISGGAGIDGASPPSGPSPTVAGYAYPITASQLGYSMMARVTAKLDEYDPVYAWSSRGLVPLAPWYQHQDTLVRSADPNFYITAAACADGSHPDTFAETSQCVVPTGTQLSLTGSANMWAPSDATVSGYAWYACTWAGWGTDASGYPGMNVNAAGCSSRGTSAKYTTTASDAGLVMIAQMRTTGQSWSSYSTSDWAQTAPFELVPGAPSNKDAPALVNMQSGKLAAAPGNWDNNPLPRYQWQQCATADCADPQPAMLLTSSQGTGLEYVPVGDVTTVATSQLAQLAFYPYVQVVVTGSNRFGQASATTRVVDTRVPLAPVNLVAPTATSQGSVGTVTSTGSWDVTPSRYTYSWYSCAADPTCASSTYVSSGEDPSFSMNGTATGGWYRAMVSATHTYTTPAGSYTATTGAFTNSIELVGPPESTGAPEVSLSVTGLLSMGNGAWSTAIDSFSYAWERCTSLNNQGHCIAWASAGHGATLQLAVSDLGTWYRATVTATNAAGSASAHTIYKPQKFSAIATNHLRVNSSGPGNTWRVYLDSPAAANQTGASFTYQWYWAEGWDYVGLLPGEVATTTPLTRQHGVYTLTISGAGFGGSASWSYMLQIGTAPIAWSAASITYGPTGVLSVPDPAALAPTFSEDNVVITYQWRFQPIGGTQADLPGETSNVLDAHRYGEGLYYCDVTATGAWSATTYAANGGGSKVVNPN